MHINSDIDINELLARPIWQMSGREFCALTQFAYSAINGSSRPQKLCFGVDELSTELGCSSSLIYDLKRKGVLDEAIVSHIGKPICFDIELARSLANAFQKRRNNND